MRAEGLEEVHPPRSAGDGAMTSPRDRFAQIRRDREHAAELAHIANACAYCGSVHPSITNHGPDGFERVVVDGADAPPTRHSRRRRRG